MSSNSISGESVVIVFLLDLELQQLPGTMDCRVGAVIVGSHRSAAGLADICCYRLAGTETALVRLAPLGCELLEHVVQGGQVTPAVAERLGPPQDRVRSLRRRKRYAELARGG